jgi:hypothetical protein
MFDVCGFAMDDDGDWKSMMEMLKNRKSNK